MSRARVHEVSSPISLFPFIGILLCTMGSLLVILVAVSRSAHDSAVREATATNTSANDEARTAAQAELSQVGQYMIKLKQLRTDAEKKLRDDQLRMGELENHMRGLQDKLRALQTASIELDAMEEEHYDDRKQAEREIERLHKLIAEGEAAIASLDENFKSRKGTYALVPYDGPNGTFRRPMYIECRKGEIILQPEGVRISRSDLQRPIGPGNALASALRAARDHYVRLNPIEGQSRDTEPYPMILIRPEGADLFGMVRSAVEAADFEFGFEPVESSWELEYGAPDPQLARDEEQAIEQARIRQRALALAAPRAYSNPRLAAAGQFDPDEMSDGFGYAGGSGGGEGDGEYEDSGRSYGDDYGSSGYGGSGQGGGPGGEGDIDFGAPANGGGGHGGSGDGAAGGGGSGSGETNVAFGGRKGGGESYSGNASADAGATAGPGEGNINGTPGGTLANGAPHPSSNFPQPKEEVPGALPPEMSPDNRDVNISAGATGMDSNSGLMGPRSSSQTNVPPDARAQDWALRKKGPQAVPIRRSIRVIVRNDRLAIMPDGAPMNGAESAGKMVPLQGDTIQSVDEFVNHVRKQVDGWGIAGDGLYWRPVLVLNVGPDGMQRANDLARLLKKSGLEVNMGNVASKPALRQTQ